jgi:hypothetical protein
MTFVADPLMSPRDRLLVTVLVTTLILVGGSLAIVVNFPEAALVRALMRTLIISVASKVKPRRAINSTKLGGGCASSHS